jgi:hypothetical protein
VVVGGAVGVGVWVVVGKGVAVGVGGTAVSVTCTTTSSGASDLSSLPQATNNKINKSKNNCFFIMAQL